MVGHEIKCRRRVLGLSGAELAKKLHVSQQQVSRYECGICHITVEKLLVILVVLDVSVSDFFRGVGHRLISEVSLQDAEVYQIYRCFLPFESDETYRRFLSFENDEKG